MANVGGAPLVILVIVILVVRVVLHGARQLDLQARGRLPRAGRPRALVVVIVLRS